MENHIINEASIEEIFKNDNEAINWLNSVDNPKFNNILNILYTYAKKCLRELDKKDLSEGIDKDDKREIIEKVKQYLTRQEDFREKCLITSSNSNRDEKEFRLGILNEEEIKYIQKLSQEDIDRISSEDIEENSEQKELISKIRKVNRFYNMQLKLAHTARIVKVSDEILKTFEGNLNPDLKDIILTSALLHDVGRFYQAKEYDNFNDKNMKLDKEEYGSGHSKAGYYYSMMDLFRMNFFSDTVDKDLVLRTVAGFVVSYHSESNINLEDNEIVANEECIKGFGESNIEGEALDRVIGKAYSTAEFIDFEESDIEQKQFIKKFMQEIISEKGSDTIEAFSFDEDRISKITKNIADALEKGFSAKTNEFFREHNKRQQKEDTDITIDELTEELSEAFTKGANIQLDKKDIKRALINMANYDVAKSIYQMFSEKGTTEEERLKGALFALPLNIVMDADKIDILNQLANGTYPITYNPKKYKLFDKDDKFIGMVEKEEAFKSFFEENEDIIIMQSDKENFAKYNGLKREDNISPVRSTLWLLNQFIFTNMRNKGSLVCVKDNRFIEKTYEQFSEDENVQKILKPYMAYTLFFLDRVTELENQLLTPELMKEQCEQLWSMYNENDMIKEEYEEIFNGDILAKREKFLQEKTKRIITVREIGKATINTPTTAKKEAEQLENGENIKNNTKEGEKITHDN